MQKWHRIILLLYAASLLIASARPRAALAGETDEISPSSQAVHADSIAPAPPAQPGAAPDQRVPYQMDQDTSGPEPQGAQEYMDANEQVSVFGIEMRVDTRKAERDVQGLLVIDIEPGSPGASAGLRPFRERTRDVLNGVGMLAAMAFPPAIVIVPIVESVPLHESYDLIIGVDGTRVTNFADLWERMRTVRPGEIVYLNLLRDGHRVQVPMQVTSAVPPPQAWVR
jgi:C-terminal processing protease CtpA/Prc